MGDAMYGKATQNAIAAMSRLAEVYDGGKTRISAADIAASRDLQKPFVSKLLSTLSNAGYRVLSAASGEEAFEVCRRRRPGVIDLLATDVIMPGALSGVELAQRLIMLYPKIKVLYISGYSDEAIVHHGLTEPGVAFLQKPFTTDLLIRKVRDVLDESKGRRPLLL